MAEHRNLLDPAILGRLAASVEQFAAAWQADLAALRLLEEQLADVKRDRDASLDRAAFVEQDLREERERNEALTRRNAYLEAQMQSLYEKAEDAKDGLDALSRRTVDAARTAPEIRETAIVHGRQQDEFSQDPPPTFLSRPQIRGLPDNEFQPRRPAAQR